MQKTTRIGLLGIGVAGGLFLHTVPVQAADHAPQARACVTTKAVVARQLRHEDAIPIVAGLRAGEVTACHGKWAVITVSGEGDSSFNARYRHGRWHFNAGYPMGPCGRAPHWLCPNHP